MKRAVPSKVTGGFLIVISTAAFVFAEHSIREINTIGTEVNGAALSLELRLAAYFICALVLVTGIALCLRPWKLSGMHRS